MAELVPGIGHRNWVRAFRNAFSSKNLGSLRAGEPVWIEAEMDGERPVQLDQSGRRDGRRYDAGEKVRWQRRISVFKGEMDRHGLKIGMRRE